MRRRLGEPLVLTQAVPVARTGGTGSGQERAGREADSHWAPVQRAQVHFSRRGL